MKFSINFFFLFFSICISVNAQVLDYAKKIIDTLSSTSMHGRGYVNDGVNIAANYLVDNFKSYGLKVNEQQFSFFVNTLPGEVLIQSGNEKLIPGADYLVSSYSHSLQGTYDVVVCEKTTFLSKKSFKKFIEDAPEQYFMYIQIDEYNAEERKILTERLSNYRELANGFIIRSKTKLTWGSSEIISPNPVIYINEQGAKKIASKIEVKIDAVQIDNFKTRNIIAQTTNFEIDSTILFTAHYDHLGQMGSNIFFPGANDNASGIAMQSMLAKYFGSQKNKYKYVFIAFSAEERGLIGSKYFVDNPIIDLGKIKLMYNIDLCGTGDEGFMLVNAQVIKDKVIAYNPLTEKYVKFLFQKNESENFVKKISMRINAPNSDHYWFAKKNIPALFMYTLGGGTAYHDIYDTPDKLTLTAFDNIYTLLISIKF